MQGARSPFCRTKPTLRVVRHFRGPQNRLALQRTCKDTNKVHSTTLSWPAYPIPQRVALVSLSKVLFNFL